MGTTRYEEWTHETPQPDPGFVSDLAQPRRRDGLYSSTVRSRFVVLDASAKQLVELHPDVRDLWPLLDGSYTVNELVELWHITARVGTEEDGPQLLQTVLEQLSTAGLLATEHREGAS